MAKSCLKLEMRTIGPHTLHKDSHAVGTENDSTGNDNKLEETCRKKFTYYRNTPITKLKEYAIPEAYNPAKMAQAIQASLRLKQVSAFMAVVEASKEGGGL